MVRYCRSRSLWRWTWILAVFIGSSFGFGQAATGQSGKVVKHAAHNQPASAARTFIASKRRRAPLLGPVIYDNGPANGTLSAWQINFGFAVSDSFVLGSGATIGGFSFAAWLTPLDTLSSVDVSITSAPFGGTTYFSQTVAFSQSNCTSNQFGFDVCTETGSFAGPNLLAGTYWFNLQNASVASGGAAYWDENSGVGCLSSGCPSMASENMVGTIASEAFDVFSAPGIPTATTLTVIPSSASAGQVVTLQASVVDSGNNPVTIGTVTFLSGPADFPQVLGTVQATDSPPVTATLKIRLGPGTYSLTALYNANRFFQASQSIPQPLTVTGTEPTITTLTATPDGSNYDFADSVFGFGFPSLSGSGSLNNLTQGGINLGTIQIPGPGMSSFQPQKLYSTNNFPFTVAVSDFNGDGIADLAVTDGATSVVVLLGNGDGTFQAEKAYATGAHPYEVAVGDFNGDGSVDLAVTNNSNNTVSVLLGKGDGTFQTQQTYPVGNSPGGIAIGDFNLDGIADLVIANDVDNTLSVLLGNGDGTFQAQQTYPVGSMPLAIVASDFNGDGIPDLAVTNVDDSTVGVLLGNGDGTFQSQAVYPTGAVPFGLAVADFNGDGFADLATADQGGQSVSVLLGNGNGTFQPPQSYPIKNIPVGVVAADFNGDGIPDLAATNAGGGTVSILLGNGDGTFQPQQAYPTGLDPYYFAVGDFNGDGVPDLAVPNQFDGTVSILLGGTLTTGQITNVPVYGTGNQEIQSNFTPVGNFYAGSGSNIVTVKGEQIPTNTSLSSSQNPSSYLQPVTFTATVTATGGGSPTGTVDFTDNGAPITGCTGVPLVPVQNGSTATCMTSSLAVGSHNIVASYSGDNKFASSGGSGSQTVTKSNTATAVSSVPNPSQLNQLVTITAVVSGQFGGTPTGTVDFSDGTRLLCRAVPLGNSGSASCQTQTLAAGTHQLGAVYNGDNNFSASSGSTMQTVNGGSITTMTQLTSSVDPSEVNQPVKFTATVTVLDGLPSGNVTFTSNGKPIPECPNPVPVMQMGNSSVASCTTQSLSAGSDGVLAIFNDPSGLFGTSFGSLLQTVQDFFLPPIFPAAVTVIQGFNNTNQPFFAQTIYLEAQPLYGYGGTVAFSCSVSPALAGGSCTVNPPSSGSLAGGSLITTLAISAGSTTPIGSYTVTVTAQDGGGLMRFATLALTVIDDAPGIVEPPGGAGRTPVSFNGPPGIVITNLACTEVTGTGITGSEDLSKIGGVCTFSPGSISIPGSVVVTISGCTVARLGKRTPIFAVFLFGLPALVLLGSVRPRRISGKSVLRVSGIMLLVTLLLISVSCGGGGGSGQLTPTGNYLVLVQGTGSDGAVYSAVVPVTVH